MLANPADLDTAFEYAALSERAGDLEAAISTLERMLIFAPGLPRLQYELGILYFRLGAYETAATYLNAVDTNAADVPAEIRTQIATYLAEIETRSSGSAFAGSVSAGVKYQTNANSGPGTLTINLNNIEFLLNPEALGTPDVSAFVAGNVKSSLDLESQGDRLDVSLAGYASVYRAQNTLNAATVELKVGPTFNLQRFEIDNAALGFYGVAGATILGGAPYLVAAGVGAKYAHVLDAQSKLTVEAQAKYERYLDSAARPTASLRSGPYVTAKASFEHQLSAGIGLFASFGVDRRLAQRSYLSNWQLAAQAGASFKFASPIDALTDPWTLIVSTGVQGLLADAPDPVFSLTDVERTAQAIVQATLTVPLPDQFALQTSASYTHSFSNYGLGNYRNVSLSAALSKGF
jgi:tetratricopeptide (TPR) repeat protein